jgi:hypothetical protein
MGQQHRNLTQASTGTFDGSRLGSILSTKATRAWSLGFDNGQREQTAKHAN